MKSSLNFPDKWASFNELLLSSVLITTKMLDKVGKNPVACNDLDDPKLNRFSLLDGNVSDDENTLNNPEDNDDFIIKGLSEMALGSLSSEKDDANLYLAKGPMFR